MSLFHIYQIGGNYNWSDVKVSIDAFVPNINGTEGVFLAARVDQGGCDTDRTLGIFLWIYPGKLFFFFLSLRNTFILIKFQTINTKTFSLQEISLFY